MNRGRPPTGTRSGAAIVGPQIVDRPMTQHGLGGMKNPKTSHGGRQVQDKSFWLGQIRAKMNEVSDEIHRLEQEMVEQEEQAESFISYKRRAAQSASELQLFQNKLQDANTTIERHNQHLEAEDVEDETAQIAMNSELEQDSLNNLFNDRQGRENELRLVEHEIEKHLSQTQQLLQNMSDVERDTFLSHQKQFQKVSEDISAMEQAIEETRLESVQLEGDLVQDPIRNELVPLYADLKHLMAKRNEQELEERNKLTPAQEMEKLTRQLKHDNQAILTMEKQIGAVEERVNRLTDDLRNMESDLDESYLQKIKGLRQTEEKFKKFLESYPDYVRDEQERMSEKEEKVTELLAQISRIIQVTQILPEEAAGFGKIQSNLEFKERELAQNEGTVHNLQKDNVKLQNQLRKIEAMETKLKTEIENLNSENDHIENELDEFTNLKALEERENEKGELLEQTRNQLTEEIVEIRQMNEQLADDVKNVRAQLKNSDEQNLIDNLERRWSNTQQNNQAMAEFIAGRTVDCVGLQARTRQHLQEYNQIIMDRLKNQTPQTGY